MSDSELESELRTLIADAHRGEAHFNGGFADRVMSAVARGAQDGAQDLAGALVRQTRRLLPALIAASIALLAWNAATGRSEGASPLAAAFGIRSAATAQTSSAALTNAEQFQ